MKGFPQAREHAGLALPLEPAPPPRLRGTTVGPKLSFAFASSPEPLAAALKNGSFFRYVDRGLVQGMKIINGSEVVLTNYEVKRLLEKQQADQLREEMGQPLPGARRGQSSSSTAWQSRQQAALISEQILTHLSSTCCESQTEERIRTFMSAIAQESFQLTPAETLSLINLQPRSRAEISTLIEECEERLSADDTTKLLQLVCVLAADGEGMT